MAGSPTPRQVQAAQIVERAENGEMIEGRSYSIQDLSGQLAIGIQPILANNCGLEQGDTVQPYIDPVRGIAVYDFSGALDVGDDGGQ